MEEIKIIQKNQGVGFQKPIDTEFAGVIFDNGKIAYVDSNDFICSAHDKSELIRSLKQDKTCVDAYVIHNHKG